MFSHVQISFITWMMPGLTRWTQTWYTMNHMTHTSNANRSHFSNCVTILDSCTSKETVVQPHSRDYQPIHGLHFTDHHYANSCTKEAHHCHTVIHQYHFI